MRAAFVTEPSAADPVAAIRVGDLDPPAAPDGWIRVDVRAGALNMHDLWTLRGVTPRPHAGPHVLGSDAAGVAGGRDVVVYPVLPAAGVPTVPSAFFAPGQPVRIPPGEVVVKPSVGAGSVGALRFSNSLQARAHAEALQAAGRTALVQPYDARVGDGETALVFLGGQQSHAFTKGPILPSPGERPVFDESGTYAEEQLRPADPDFELWDVGHAALAAAAGHLGLASSDLL